MLACIHCLFDLLMLSSLLVQPAPERLRTWCRGLVGDCQVCTHCRSIQLRSPRSYPLNGRSFSVFDCDRRWLAKQRFLLAKKFAKMLPCTYAYISNGVHDYGDVNVTLLLTGEPAFRVGCIYQPLSESTPKSGVKTGPYLVDWIDCR